MGGGGVPMIIDFIIIVLKENYVTSNPSFDISICLICLILDLIFITQYFNVLEKKKNLKYISF